MHVRLDPGAEINYPHGLVIEQDTVNVLTPVGKCWRILAYYAFAIPEIVGRMLVEIAGSVPITTAARPSTPLLLRCRGTVR